MTAILLEIALALRLAAAVPVADPLAHVQHAGAVASGHPELVLAIAWYESGLRPAPQTEPHHCGVMQVDPRYVLASCLEMRSPAVGYAAGVEVLRRWLRHSGGRWREAVRGYRCGWLGLDRDCPQEPSYDDKVLALAARLGWRP